MSMPIVKQTTLAEYTAEVNALSRAECDRLNATKGKPGGILFAAVHHDYPERMLAWYQENGLTPKQAFRQMNEEAQSEGRAEAACS